MCASPELNAKSGGWPDFEAVLCAAEIIAVVSRGGVWIGRERARSGLPDGHISESGYEAPTLLKG